MLLCAGFLFNKRVEIGDMIEELSSDLVVALREGITFRLLKVRSYLFASFDLLIYFVYFKINIDLLRVLIELRNVHGDNLFAPASFTDPRNKPTCIDNMLRVLCACGQLVPRVVTQIAELVFEKW